jgi:integrase-like protein
LKFLPFNEAKAFVHKLGLKTELEWRKYCKSGGKPENIPSTVNGVYNREWRGWGDWLGNGKEAQYKGNYKSFDEARNFVRQLQLKNQSDWQNYCVTGNKPEDIPSSPSRVYKAKGWKNLGDWLGTNTVANQNKVYYSFEDARELW